MFSKKKSKNIKFNRNPSSGNRVIPCGRTDRQNEANTAFRNFANAHKNEILYIKPIQFSYVFCLKTMSVARHIQRRCEMSMKNCWNDANREKPLHSEKLSQCYFVHHNSHRDGPGNEPGPPREDAGHSTVKEIQVKFSLFTSWRSIEGEEV